MRLQSGAIDEWAGRVESRDSDDGAGAKRGSVWVCGWVWGNSWVWSVAWSFGVPSTRVEAEAALVGGIVYFVAGDCRGDGNDWMLGARSSDRRHSCGNLPGCGDGNGRDGQHGADAFVRCDPDCQFPFLVLDSLQLYFVQSRGDGQDRA